MFYIALDTYRIASHGALALAYAKTVDGKSIIYDRTLTTLPQNFEQSVC